MENDNKNRIKEGVITSAVGVGLNALLAIGKLIAGVITSSVSVISDAVNNFADAGSSVITLASFKLSAKAADRDHPYGHGRTEYIAGFITAMLIIFIAAELIITSIKRIITPVITKFSVFTLVTLIVSIAVKAAMAAMYFIKNRTLKAEVVKASAIDALSDCAVTTVIAITFALENTVSFPLDAVAGLLVAVIVAISGVKIMISTVNKLLGSRDNSETERRIVALLSSHSAVMGYHDLRVHDYGQHKVASVDAEFDESSEFIFVHSVVNAIERQAAKEGIDLVIHPDPVPVGDDEYLAVRHDITLALERYAHKADFHELSLDKTAATVSLHLSLDESLMKNKEEIVFALSEAMEKRGYTLSISYDFM